MLLRCVFTVLTEMYISLATSAVFSMPDTSCSTSRSRSVSGSTNQNRDLIRGTRASRALLVAQGRGEYAPVGVNQFRVTLQHRPDPATLRHEWQPELFRFSQVQRGRK